MLNCVYWQVLDVLEAVFVAIFDGINEKCEALGGN
jgi:hypothetical protein